MKVYMTKARPSALRSVKSVEGVSLLYSRCKIEFLSSCQATETSVLISRFFWVLYELPYALHYIAWLCFPLNICCNINEDVFVYYDKRPIVSVTV